MHGPLSRNLRSRSNVFEFTPVDYCLDGLSRTIASDDDSFFHDAAHTGKRFLSIPRFNTIPSFNYLPIK